MKISKFILFLSLYFFIENTVFANTIDIDSFYELMHSALVNNDVYNFTSDMNSTESIGNHFYNYNINFDGNNHYIDGNDSFGGFILSRENTFDEVIIRHCKGQFYNGSNFGGAIFNSSGKTDIENSDFVENFVNSGDINYGVAGAVYNLYGGSMSIENSNFEHNYTYGAGSFGGALANGYDDNGTAQMNINRVSFKNNYSSGVVFVEGGAIYNNGNIVINNSEFDSNYIEALPDREEASPFIYGGAVFNNGEMLIENSEFNNNYSKGSQNSIAFGGAVFNAKTMDIKNSSFSKNSIQSSRYGDGAVIYNAPNAVMNISNSLFEDNVLDSSISYGDGGAVYNSGVINLDSSVFKNNHDRNQLNDIYNNSTGTLNFNGTGNNSILSGISGSGNINKNDSGSLNLGGENSGFVGNFTFNNGTLNLLADSSYFNAQNSNFHNNINFNMINGQINNINFGNLSLDGQTNIFTDVNFGNNSMDKINANSLNGNGTIMVSGLNVLGAPEAERIVIPFADSVLKNSVRYNNSTLNTPIYDYSVSYDANSGDFLFIRGGFDSAVFASEVAAQLAGYLVQIDTYKNIFANLDMVMLTPYNVRNQFSMVNKTAASDGKFALSPFVMPEQRGGIWFKPYSSFETVGLKNGPDVSNVMYGSLVVAESPLMKLKKNWYTLYGAYASYNGSHQAYSGNSIYNNGGLIGIEGAFYKGNFFTVWTANVGANSAEASSGFGAENFAMLNTGIAQMSGYNFETVKRKLIIQPSVITSYSFVNTFSYTAPSGVNINTEPLHAVQIEPRIKLIGNFKNYLQPYISVSMIWNIIDHARFQANDVYLPALSVEPFVQYGAGVQKRWADRLTGFFETMIRNGGRSGIALQLGLRISI